MINRLSGLAFSGMEPIHKGWSKDKKYCVTDEKGTRYEKARVVVV